MVHENEAVDIATDTCSAHLVLSWGAALCSTETFYAWCGTMDEQARLASVQAALDVVPMSEDLRPFNGTLRPPTRCKGLTGLEAPAGLVAIVIHDGGDLSLYVSPLWRERIIKALAAHGYRYAELETADDSPVYGGVFLDEAAHDAA